MCRRRRRSALHACVWHHRKRRSFQGRRREQFGGTGGALPGDHRSVMMERHVRPRALVTLAAVLCLTGAAAAGFGVFDGAGLEPAARNIRYDGRFTFARLKYTTGPGGYYYCGLPAWAHGYVPCRDGSRSGDKLMKIMKELTYLNPHTEDRVALAVEDSELAKYPDAHTTVAGYRTLTDLT